MGPRSKTLRLLVTAFLALSLALAACGTDDEGAQEQPDDPAPPDTAEETPADEPDPEPDEPEDTDEDEVAEFYSQNPLTIQVGFGEGGGFDTASRLLARHIGRHIPGNPDVIVVNNPGAGSVTNANDCFNRAPADGSIICVNHRELINAQMFDQEGLQFDMEEFGWIGGIGRSQYVTVVLTEVATTLEEALDAPLIFGGSGPGTSTYGGAVLINELLDKDYDIVAGYADAGSIRIALEGGEVNAAVLGVDPYFVQTPHWIEDEFTMEMMIVGREREDRLPDIPTIYEFLETDEQERVADLFTAPGEMGYAFSTPPDLPDHMLQVLKDAFQATLEDPEFQADAEDINLDYDNSPTGEDIEGVIAQVFATPEEDIELFRSYMEAED